MKQYKRKRERERMKEGERVQNSQAVKTFFRRPEVEKRVGENESERMKEEIEGARKE